MKRKFKYIEDALNAGRDPGKVRDALAKQEGITTYEAQKIMESYFIEKFGIEYQLSQIKKSKRIALIWFIVGITVTVYSYLENEPTYYLFWGPIAYGTYRYYKAWEKEKIVKELIR